MNFSLNRHDVFLMDAVLEHTPSFPPKIFKCFNACQIFLQVFALAINMSYTYLCDGYLEESTLGCHTHYHHICLQE